jgi:hypothetical protein
MAMHTRSRISRCVAAAILSVGIAGAAGAASAAGVATGQTGPDKATQMLFDAVHTNDFAAAEAAVAAGANVEARDRWDISPVELAVDKGYFRIAHFLVSVRNSRTPAADLASRAPTEPVRAAAPSQPQAAASPPKKAASAPAKAAPQPQQHVVQPQWPAGTPNPFDPATPAFGTAIPVIPAAPPSSADAAETDGPMLANDEAVQRKGQAVR